MLLSPRKILLLSIIFMVAVALCAPMIGSRLIEWPEVLGYLNGEVSAGGTILFQIRLPRVLLGMLTGSTLAVAGVVFQALLRNPLATPYTLGIAGGSAFGALLAIKLGLGISLLGFSGVQIAAFAGSMLTISLVYLVSGRLGGVSIYTLILAGVTVNYFFGASILILHYLADFTETHQMIRWTIGGLGSVDYPTLLRTMPVILVGSLVFMFMGRSFNLMSTSEEMALSKGVNVVRVQQLSFIVASLMTGVIVALTGPIGFVGLIIPHLLRIVSGPDHRYLIPASFCLGAGFLVFADTLARTVLSPIDLPVGIFTTLLGGPFFIWLLVKRKEMF